LAAGSIPPASLGVTGLVIPCVVARSPFNRSVCGQAAFIVVVGQVAVVSVGVGGNTPPPEWWGFGPEENVVNCPLIPLIRQVAKYAVRSGTGAAFRRGLAIFT